MKGLKPETGIALSLAASAATESAVTTTKEGFSTESVRARLRRIRIHREPWRQGAED